MSADRLPTSALIRYGMGQVGGQIFRDTPATLLPLFFTTMLGVAPWLAGLAVLVPKLWIIICDPLMGAVSDRTKQTWGRLPFLALGGAGTAIGFFLLFAPPDFSLPWLYVVYIGAIYTLAATAFSMFSVPYLALASEMSADYHERTRILSYRIIFTAIGIVLAVGFAQPLIGWLGGGRDAWMQMAAIFGLICFASTVGCAFFMRKVQLIPQPVQEVPDLVTQFRLALENRPFRLLLATHFTQQLGQAASYSAIALIFIYAIQDVALIIPFIMVMSVTSLTTQQVWISASRRFGKKSTYIFCVLAWMALTATWFLVGPSDDVLVTLPLYGALSSQHAWVLVRAVVIGLVNSGFILMSMSLLTDTIDYDRRRNPGNREGIFSGVYSAAEKLAFALGPALGGVILSATGFASSTGGAAAQSADAVQGILMVFALLPIVFFGGSLFILARYDLDEAGIQTAGDRTS